jgi:hypothetical protein
VQGLEFKAPVPQKKKIKKELDEQIKEIIKCRSNITIKARKGEKESV